MSLADTLIYATNGSGSVAALQHDGSSNLKVSVENALTIDTTGLATDSGQTTANSHLSAIETAVEGTLLVDGSATTQPISATALPLPSGASTSSAQATANGHLSTLAGAVSGTEVQVDIVSSATLNVDGSATTQPISATALPLPTGASTSANQVSGNSSLSSIDGKITQGSDLTLTNAQQVLCYGRDNGGTLDVLRTDASGHLEVVIDDFTKGQATSANSFPVVLSSDQSALTTNSDKTSATSSLWSSQSLAASSTNNTSGVLDFQDYSVLQIVGNTTNTNDPIYIEFSTDNTTYYRDGTNTIYPDFTSGDFVVSFTDVACRYVRAVKDNNEITAETITLIAAVRKN